MNQMRMTHLLLVAVVVVAVVPSAMPSNSTTRLPLTQRRGRSYNCGECVCTATRNLLTANCTSKHLNSVPRLPNSSFIDVLLMDSNNLQELNASCLSSYTILTELNLANNMIATIHTEAFQNQHKLQYLNLTGNRLKYVSTVFKANMFRYLNKLRVLSLERNAQLYEEHQTYPDAALSDLVSLEYLHLDGLTNQSFGKGFSKLTSLKELSFKNGYCNLQSLFNTTFVHVKQVRSLDLSHCNIIYMEADTFSPFKYSLLYLDLSHNTLLGFDKVGLVSYGWQNSSLSVLNISSIVIRHAICIKITKNNLKFFTNTNINQIIMDNNRIEAFQNGALPYLPKTLEKVSIRSQRLAAGTYLKDMIKLTGLKEIDLSGKPGVRNIPVSHLESMITTTNDCLVEDEPSCSILVHSKHNELLTEAELNIPDNVTCPTTEPILVPLPPNLSKIIFTYKQLSFCISAMTIRPNSLYYLDISYNLLSTWIGPIKGLNKLKYLDLSNNLATFASPGFFEHFRGLEFLNISWNLLNNVIVKDREGKLFGNLTSLKVFDLSGNTIQKLPPHLFNGLPNLRKIILTRNYLYSESTHVKHMKTLSKIDFSYNMLRWLSKTLRSDLDNIADTQNHEVTIDLSYNPISCECANLEFLTWMLKSKIKQFENRRNYYCLDINGKNISLAQLQTVVRSLEHSCTNYFGLSLGIVTLAVLFIVISSGGVCYRCRWKFKYWYYRARYNYKRDGSLDSFLYDAYISYAPEDEAFFLKMMENKLENKIISRRTIDPQKNEISEIVDRIRMSRHTVLVLSENFLQCGMCSKEMETAILESSYTGRDVLIVKLENLTYELIPEEILHLFQNDSYIEYLSENDQMFWQRFNEAIGRN